MSSRLPISGGVLRSESQTPPPPPEAGQSTITATHTTDTAKELTDTITISYGASVVVSPVAVLVNAGGTVEFTATTTNLSPEKVIWSASYGTSIPSTGDLTGTWTAPIDAGVYTITAKSVANNDVTGSAQATVELSGEPTGTFSEGFYYGRKQKRCEWPDPGDPDECDTDDNLGHSSAVWMWIHKVDGQTVVELHSSAITACAWPGFQRFPGTRVIGNVTNNTAFPVYNWRLTVSSIGSTTTLPPQGILNWNPLCYQGCRENNPYSGSVFRDGAVIRFETNIVTLMSLNLGNEERWIFVKDDERDPFGEWAFHPDSLEATPHPDRIK